MGETMLKRAAAFFAVILLFFSHVSRTYADTNRTFFAMDTVMSIYAPGAADTLLDECAELVTALEEKLSVTDGESQIARLNAGESVSLDSQVRGLLTFALAMCARTDGALDITLYPIVRAWGFTTGEYRVPAEAEIKELLQYVDYSALSLTEDSATLPDGVMIDFGSIAKGYASDELVRLLQDNGIGSALIDLGGNVYCVGKKENGSDWRIGIADPEGNGTIAVVTASDCAIITSGAYERYFESGGVRYGHIFDPKTGYPVSGDLVSVTVIGKSGAVCDALSTALFVMGTEKACAWLQQSADVEALLLNGDGIYATEGLRDILRISDAYADMPLQWIER